MFITFSAAVLYVGRFRIKSFVNRYELEDIKQFEGTKDDQKWAKKLMNGGYLIHVRHAERDKWLDVAAYDSLETSVENKNKVFPRRAENEYFANAVCLNSKGKIQAKMMGEHLKNIKFPIGYVLTSPSCRARQTAELAFGGYDSEDIQLVHSGPYFDNREKRIEILKKIYSSAPIKKGKNTIITSHNSVINQFIFNDPDVFGLEKPKLEEGGFYIISRNENGLKMEHEFHSFTSFIRQFYTRQ